MVTFEEFSTSRHSQPCCHFMGIRHGSLAIAFCTVTLDIERDVDTSNLKSQDSLRT